MLDAPWRQTLREAERAAIGKMLDRGLDVCTS